MPLLAVGMLAIIGIVGLSIDVGHAFLNKTRLQNSLDSAAISGARTLMLSNDIVAASADARSVFADHLTGEMAALDAGDLILQYSDKLVPFVTGGSRPRYVRAVFRDFTTNMSFSSVLPDVNESMSVTGSAVAGPIPVGYSANGETCDIAPLLMCGLPGDRDCTDNSCFDFDVGTRTEYQFQLNTGIESDFNNLQAAEANEQLVSKCGEDSIYYNCIPVNDSHRYFLLNKLECEGTTCIRNNLAGGFNSCLLQNTMMETQQVSTPVSIFQGLMTRFGIYQSSLSAVNFPPDVVVTDRIDDVDYWYDRYKRDVSSVIANGSSDNGAPYRRVLAVPIVDCQEAGVGQTTNTLLGIACFFLTRDLAQSDQDPYLYGQFVTECEASGEQGERVPKISNNYPGPMEIVLYKDPDNEES